MSQQQLAHIGDTIVQNSVSNIVKVQINHTAHAVTRFANSRVLSSDSGDTVDVYIGMRSGGRKWISFRTNMVDDDTIRIVIGRINRLASDQLGAPKDHNYVPDRPQKYLPVALWKDSTANAMGTVGETAVPSVANALKESGLRDSGAFVGLMSRAIYIVQKDGLTAFCRETDSECTVTARTANGKASGWYGEAARDWSTVDPLSVTAKAIDIANRMKEPVAVEPGRRTVILSPFAVAQVLRPICAGFDAFLTNIYRTTVFAEFNIPGRRNKIGLCVFDPRIRMSSSPTDPDGGYTPFGDIDEDRTAMPTTGLTYVDRGVLQDLAYSLHYGLEEGKRFTQNPWSLRVEAMPGTSLATVDEMIANCKEGIYVQQLSSVTELDSITGVQTGTTRDGCFFIKDGKIIKPIKNFRYVDSPMYFLNNLEMIGAAQRVAWGFVAPNSGEPKYAAEWPRRPMIVPPVMVRDFNFTSLSEAV